MPDSNLDLIRGGYQSFRRGDIDAVLDLYDKSIEWHEPDWTIGGLGGVFRGPEEVAEKVFKASQGVFEKVSVEPRYFCPDGENVFVQGEFLNRYKGRDVSVPFLHVWTLRNGKVTMHRAYIDVGQLRRTIDLARAA
jgi:ketosteroid isomerase-like protein